MTLPNDFQIALEAEADLYEIFADALEKEKQAILLSDVNGLNACLSAKEDLISKIRLASERRLELQGRLAAFYGHANQKITLTKFPQMIEEPYAASIKDACSNIADLTMRIRKANRSNTELLASSLEIVRGSLKLLNNLTLSNGVYQRSGKIRTSERGGKVLSGKI